MIRLNLTALLYSNKNIDLAYKAKRICRNVEINLINTLDFVDLTIKIVELKPQIVFFDLSTIRLEKQIMQLFISKGQYFIPNIILIYNDEAQLDEYREFNFAAVKLDELEKMLFKEEKSFKLNAVLFEHEKKNMSNIISQINNDLFTMGFSPKHTGYGYIIEAIKIVIKKQGVMGSLNNEVYPLIAAKYGTTTSNVERSIRNAIVCAFNSFDSTKNTIDANNLFSFFNERPTNRAFICMYLEKMLEQFNCMDKIIY